MRKVIPKLIAKAQQDSIFPVEPPVEQALLFHDKVLCGFNANVYQQAKHNPMMREIVLFFCKYRIEHFANTKGGEIQAMVLAIKHAAKNHLP